MIGTGGPVSNEGSPPFSRGLSDELLAWLFSDVGQQLRGAFAEHKLDVRIRGEYLNAYRANCSVAKVGWRRRDRQAELRIHRKFLVDTPLLLGGQAGGGNYVTLPATVEGIETYRSSLRTILHTVDDYIGEEGRWEQRCVAANLDGTPLLVIDRQIVNGRPPVKLDMLAVAPDASGSSLVAVELKRDLDNRIQHVAEQTLKYVRMLDPAGEGLRADIAASYQTVCGQLRALGLKACAPELVRPRMRVVGLVALAAYDERSTLLKRALESAGRLDRPIRFCRIDQDRLTLPAESNWFS